MRQTVMPRKTKSEGRNRSVIAMSMARLKAIWPLPAPAKTRHIKTRHIMCIIWSDGGVIREAHVELPPSAENMLCKGLIPQHAEIWRHCGPASEFMRPTTPQSQCIALLSREKASPENDD